MTRADSPATGGGMSHIELGHSMITFVEPHREQTAEYNRWYEHDHAYAAVTAAPGCFAYRRFVATKPLKSLRYPDPSAVAQPVGKGSYISLFWFEKDRVGEVFDYSFGVTPSLAARADEQRPRPRLDRRLQLPRLDRSGPARCLLRSRSITPGPGWWRVDQATRRRAPSPTWPPGAARSSTSRSSAGRGPSARCSTSPSATSRTGCRP